MGEVIEFKKELTVAEIFETLTEDQKQALYYILGYYIEKGKSPRRLVKYYWLVAPLDDNQKLMVEFLIDEVMKDNK